MPKSRQRDTEDAPDAFASLVAPHVPPHVAPHVAPAQGQVRIGPLLSVAVLLREHGVEPATVLARCGLSPTVFDDPRAAISHRDAACLLQQAAWVLQRADFGLLIGQRFDLQQLGVLGALMLRSPTVGAALHNLIRFFHLQDRGSVIYLHQPHPGIAALGYAFFDPDTPGAGLIYDTVVTMIHTALRAICGPEFRATEVCLPHGQPPALAPYRRCFGAPLLFDASHAELRFDARWLQAATVGANAAALDAGRRAALAVESGTPARTVELARAAVRTLVMTGRLSGPRVAEALSLRERTLRRRLAAEGSSLHALIGEARFDAAQMLLRETRLALRDVAEVLGYADVSAFVRAFRAWAGDTPGRWRDVHGAPHDELKRPPASP